VLTLAAAALGTEAVAHELGLSCHMVRDLVASAARKLGARSKLEAVAIALGSGEIDLPL
jgi:DNA-binding CsgD family transcriptional regulator